MITGIEYLNLEVADIGPAATALAAVLGRDAQPEASGTSARLDLDNCAVVIGRSADAATAAADATTALRLVLAADDLAATQHRLERRGLAGARNATGDTFDIAVERTHGVPIAVAAARSRQPDRSDADIAGLDHVVVRTPDPERAVALYGGRLGLDLRLDRTNPEIGNRLLFFVVGGLVVEISHDTRKGVGAGPDRIFGLAWRARDIERAHARMTGAGVALSEIRTGRRPGTRVFTVKSHTCGVPTLVIGGEGLARS